MMGEGSNIKFPHDKLWDEMPKLEEQGAKENLQLVAPRHVGHTGAHLKSHGDAEGAPEVISANRETPVKCSKGIKRYSSK